MMRRNKYGNIRTARHDSRKESRRAAVLSLLEKKGTITDLREQVRFELIPAQYEVISIGGTRKRKCIERACTYIADFVYLNEQGEQVVEDVKSPITRTKEYIIKRKLMLFVYGIRVKEV
ncbi:MAG: DUF1064 domain-containing protein [Prevotella sp.]|nr:DUF1064 domain-containing protein [Prevotella sp.]